MLWFTKQQLKYKSPAARLQAVEELCAKATGDRRLLALLGELLSDPEPAIRRLALTAIGNSDDERRLEAITRGLVDADANVRRAAVLGAKRLSDSTHEPQLVRLLNDPDFGVRAAAAGALDGLKWKPKDQAEELTYLVAKGQLLRAAAMGSIAVPPLVAILEQAPYSMRIAAVEALGRVNDPRVLKPVVAALKSPEAGVCVAALDVLGRKECTDAWQGVAAILRHQDSRVRAIAVETLGKLGVADAGESLRSLLTDSSWEVRRATAEALGRLKDRQSVAALIKKLTDTDADVREASAKALGTLGDRSAIAPLVMILNDPTSSVRRIAAAALVRLDEDWSSSPEAQDALAQLNIPLSELGAEFRPSPSWPAKPARSSQPTAEPVAAPVAAAAAADIPDKRAGLAVSLFAMALFDFDRDVRQAAAEALGRLGGQRAEAALNRARQDPDVGVQQAAEFSLRQISGGARAAAAS